MHENQFLLEINNTRSPNRVSRLLTRFGGTVLMIGVSLLPLFPAIAIPLSPSEPAQTKQTPPDALPIPLAIVRPDGDTITIQMINATGAELNYQVIGDTQFRLLSAQSEATLQDLTMPTTVTFRRTDGGLISATLEANNPAGTLTLILQPTEDFTGDRTALRIEPNGAVYLN